MVALKLFLTAVEAFMRNPGPNRHFGNSILMAFKKEGDERLKPFSASYHHGLFFARFLTAQEPIARTGWCAGLVSQIELTETTLFLIMHDTRGLQEFTLNLSELGEFYYQTIPRNKNKVFLIVNGTLVLKESTTQNPVHGGTHVGPSLASPNRPPV